MVLPTPAQNNFVNLIDISEESLKKVKYHFKES